MSVRVNGNGIFVEIVKGIVDAMTPVTKTYNIDTTPCLPSPSVPNTDRYGQICKYLVYCLMAVVSRYLSSSPAILIWSGQILKNIVIRGHIINRNLYCNIP